MPTTPTRRPADGKPGARQAVLCHLIRPEVLGALGWPYTTPLQGHSKGHLAGKPVLACSRGHPTPAGVRSSALREIWFDRDHCEAGTWTLVP